MNLMELFNVVKRETRQGQVGVTNDQLTTDMVTWYGARASKFWRKSAWEWGQTEISFTQPAGSVDATLDAAVGDIIVLTPNGGKPLKKATWKQYYEWVKDSANDPGTITHYVRAGRDPSSFAIKLKFHKVPAEATVITGQGKTVLTPVTVAMVAASAAIPYFPSWTHAILAAGLKADVFSMLNDKRRVDEEDVFQGSMQALIPEVEPQDQAEMNTLPDSYKWKRRMRGGTTVV